MGKSMRPSSDISQPARRVSERTGAEYTHLSTQSSAGDSSSKHGTSAAPEKGRLADLVLPPEAKPRQIMRVRAATIYDRSCKKEIARENWSATNEAVASHIKQNEKFVRGLRDTRNPIEVADLYSLPLWAVEDLIADVMAARGIKR